MPTIAQRNIATLLESGEGSLRSCLEHASARARNGRDVRMVGFRYDAQGLIVSGSFTLSREEIEGEAGTRGDLQIEYDTATLALRIIDIYTSERRTNTARPELEFTIRGYNAICGLR